MRALRIIFVVGLITWALCHLGVVAWLRERYGRGGPIPVSQAGALLSPVRGLIMPTRRTLEFIGLRPGQTVLELGPGSGYYTIEASRMVGASGRVLCLDLQPGMLQLLAPRLEANAVTNAEPVVADATRLPLADGCVDLAFLITVLGEIPDTAALAELRRVLRPMPYSPLENHWRCRLCVPGNPAQSLPGDGFRGDRLQAGAIGYTITFRASGDAD